MRHSASGHECGPGQEGRRAGGQAGGGWLAKHRASRNPGTCLPMARYWLAVSALCLAGPTLALEKDREQPIQIRSDRMQAALDDNTTVLSGNVRIVQGSLVVQAQRADITQVQGEVSRALLTGNPATLRQKVDGGGEMQAQAQTIDYKLSEETIELSGRAVLDRPQGKLMSERVVYSVRSGRLIAGEGVSGGVELVIPPRPPKAADEQPPAG